MEDKTTPHLNPEGHNAILTGSDFLTGREAHLQARLNELEAELAGLGDAPDDVESLEQQAHDALRALSDLLEPTTAVPAIPSSPEPIPAFLPGVQPANHRKPWRIAGVVAVLLVVALSAFSLIWMYGPELVGDNSPATAIVQATVTHTPMLPTSTTVSPTRPPATATPIPSPIIAAPVVPETPRQNREVVQAERVQILDVSGTLRLELPLSVMADTIQIVEGMPVLQPLLPASGAGVHRGSAPFGETGNVIIVVPPEAAPASLWQTRPGDRLVGCNGSTRSFQDTLTTGSDDACHDYLVTAVDTWPLERLHQLLANWPPGDEVLLYAALDESSAWVIQAQPQQQEGRR
jgi:hypothetical protein